MKYISYTMSIVDYFKSKRDQFCNKVKNKFLDYASYCVFKEEAQRLIELDDERNNAVALKNNIEDRIDPLYNAIRKNKEYIEELEHDNELYKKAIIDLFIYHKKQEFKLMDDVFSSFGLFDIVDK